MVFMLDQSYFSGQMRLMATERHRETSSEVRAPVSAGPVSWVVATVTA